MLTRSTTHPNLEVANEVSVRPLYHLTDARGAGDSAEIEEAISGQLPIRATAGEALLLEKLPERDARIIARFQFGS